MSGRAQRVLYTLNTFRDVEGYSHPFEAIHDFVMNINSFKTNEDYKSLTVEEEKQIIKAFLKIRG